jgi:hypothetical protein
MNHGVRNHAAVLVGTKHILNYHQIFTCYGLAMSLTAGTTKIGAQQPEIGPLDHRVDRPLANCNDEPPIHRPKHIKYPPAATGISVPPTPRPTAARSTTIDIKFHPTSTKQPAA